MSWSGGGHIIVAKIAEKHLSTVARNATSDLLKFAGKISLSDVANWADEMKAAGLPSQPSHSVRLPLNELNYEPSRDCAGGKCAIAAVNDAISTLQNNSADKFLKLVALKYLVHLIADIHQPLHASKDSGQRKVMLGGLTMSLHQAWDGGITRSQRQSNTNLAALIDTKYAVGVCDLDPVVWAYESRRIARDSIFPELETFHTIGNVTILEDGYTAKHWPVVETRLLEAAFRLACVLNTIYDPKSSRGNFSIVSD
jgi:hypothetical protein